MAAFLSYSVNVVPVNVVQTSLPVWDTRGNKKPQESNESVKRWGTAVEWD